MGRLAERARAAGVDVEVITSPTRAIKRLGDFTNNEDLTWGFQMMLIAERRKRQLEAAMRMGHVSNPRRLILADRCGLDEIAYMEHTVEVRGARGFEQLFEEGPVAELRTFTRLAHPFGMDTAQWWDLVCYKPPHPGHPPEDDGDRSGSARYQGEVDEFIRRKFGMLANRSHATHTLDIDRDAAVEDIWDRIVTALNVEEQARA